ncbi:winged helix-turn-helix transcriptional regulator [Dryocola sp. BD586]|jgi:DNA-binding HxlR family transcriptional regulator|uniref:winged helix-turn-helix transcriptional regulator n=1 Tax=Dryocola sp. BD586 TaxID=3133271 RepID=UPI003F4FD6AA
MHDQLNQTALRETIPEEFFVDGRMVGNVLLSQCPSREILHQIMGKWGLLVMLVLKNGTKRFGELRREVQGVSERMLTQTLQQLEENKMLVRKSFNTVPPHVEYTLTPLGEEAASKIKELVDWLQSNIGDILVKKIAK